MCVCVLGGVEGARSMMELAWAFHWSESSAGHETTVGHLQQNTTPRLPLIGSQGQGARYGPDPLLTQTQAAGHRLGPH